MAAGRFPFDTAANPEGSSEAPLKTVLQAINATTERECGR